MSAGLLLLSAACNDPEYRLPDAATQDASVDMLPQTDMQDMPDAVDQQPDLTQTPDDMSPDQSDSHTTPYVPRFGEPVEVDLAPYTAPLPDASGTTTVFQATDDSSLLKGALAHGRPGDFVMENSHGRYIIEGIKRVMNPCPYGGNLLDAAMKTSPDAEPNEDNLGEICVLGNLSQTFYPETTEILQAGGPDEAAILAITGKLDLLDFINFESMVREYLPATVQLPIDLNSVDPATMTIYYILRPGDKSLRTVTALRNESQETLHMAVGHLIMGGGVGSYFNPLGTNKGYGNERLSADTLDGVKFPYMIWSGDETSYAYVPEVDPEIKGTDLPAAGVTLFAAGTAATLLKQDSIIKVALGTRRQFERLRGLFHLEPGESDHVTHQFFIGDSSLGTMLDEIYPQMGLDTGTVSGQLTDTNNAPVPGARVSAISPQGRAINQVKTDAQGNYSMVLPVGEYTLEARRAGEPTLTPQNTEITKDSSVTVDLKLIPAATVTVTVQDPLGNPTPGRITVWCEGSCPSMPTSQLQDVTTDSLPNTVAAIVPTDVNGNAEVLLPEGDYRVTVTRGMEWSIWPEDAHLTNGHAISLTSGDTISLDAEIAHVVRSEGIVTGDFHIHSLTSPDSAISQRHRVLDYMSEGVDVMVSTDHDFISDYQPTIDALGANHEIISLKGSEVTTSDTGHLNAFPLQQDPNHPRGGSLDWGNGPGDSLLPSEIFDWINGFPGEQVIQVNHPAGTGTIGSLKVDTLRGISTADAESKRLPVLAPDESTGNTRLWAENFTAMELMNDHGLNHFWIIAHWWMTMVGRGFSPTMTAVTDTHRRWANIGGVPRTLVFVDPAHDAPDTFDRDTFARAINEGKAIGTNGPTFWIHLENSQGEIAQLGETLDATSDGKLFGKVKVEIPEWMNVDSLDIYYNREDVIVPAGEEDNTPLDPNMTVDINLDAQTDLEVVATGQSTHRRWVKDVEFELTMDRDSYIIVMLRNRKQGARGMKPVVPQNGIKPLAFSNPIYVDVDGDGYNNPPLKELAKTLPPLAPPPASPSVHTHADGTVHGHTHGDEAPTQLTREMLWHMIEKNQCSH